MHVGMPAIRRRRRRVRMAAVSVAAATATVVALVPATAADQTASPARSVFTADPPPVPQGVTKAPASTPIGVPGSKRPTVTAGILQSSFQGIGTGKVPWSDFHQAQLTDAVAAQVNVGNGNLLLTLTAFDVADPGPGGGLKFGHAYNGLNTSWKSSTGADYLVREPNSGAVYVQGPSGTIAVFERDGDDLTPAPGYRQDLEESSDGKTFTLTDRGSGRETTFTRPDDDISTAARVSRIEDNNGNATTFAYDGDLTRTMTGVSGRKLTFTHQDGRLVKVADHTGREATYDWDGPDLASFTDTAGATTRFDYDASHRLTKVTTPEGRQTTFTWDTNRVGSITRVTDEAEGTGPTTAFRWVLPQPGSPGEGVVRITDPRGEHTLKTVDSRWRTRKTENPLGHERSAEWNADNSVVTATDAMGVGGDPGNATTFGWNNRGAMTSAELPTGATTSLSAYQTISGADLPGTITTPDGEETDYDYDTKGNTLSVAVTGDDGGSREFTYQDSDTDCGGFDGQRCTAEQPHKDGESAPTTHFTYNGDGDLTTVDPPEPKGDTTYTYDALGRTKTVTDGRGQTLTYTYDDRDRVTRVEPETGAAIVYTWDDDGNRTSRTDTTGTTGYTYDDLSRETVRTLQDGSQTVLAYTPNGNLDYYRDAGGETDYTYDAANRLTDLTAPDGKTTTFDHNSNGERTKTTYPGGTVQEIDLDDSGRPQRITATSDAGTLVDLSYDYSRTEGGETVDGTKIRAKTDHVTGLDYTYSYNSAGRLSYAEEQDGSEKVAGWQYCYDPAGNVTSQGVTEGCPRGTEYTYNDASQLTAKNGEGSGWSYDEAGNETAGAPTTADTRTGEKYSAYNQLTEITHDGATYTAEYAGTSNAERVRFGDTTFRNTPLGLSAQTTSGVTTGFVREPAGTLNSMTRGGESYYYLTDALGSVVALTDESGNKVNSYDYKPRGSLRAGSSEEVPQPYHFTGTYHDPTHLYKMGVRYYDSRTGRFTQPDPSGQEVNPYLYANGDPVNNIDPTGKLFGAVALGITVATIGYAYYTNGQNGAEAATAAAIADAGVVALCEVGAAATTGPGAVAALPACMTIGAAAGMAVSNMYKQKQSYGY
ncbi:hypothetical protein E4198_19305 [Streptomyces sp. RKND-216]|nr:hypothetical protein E4198_19305 [Streptomyces sp. RKND-216]